MALFPRPALEAAASSLILIGRRALPPADFLHELLFNIVVSEPYVRQKREE